MRRVIDEDLLLLPLPGQESSIASRITAGNVRSGVGGASLHVVVRSAALAPIAPHQKWRSYRE